MIMRYVLTLLMAVLAFSHDYVWAAPEDVLVETELGPLAGTYLLPDTGKPKAVALIIAGSGPTDRNGNSKGIPGSNNSLKMLAEALAKNGIGSLRYDKRLIGESASTSLSEADLRFDTYIDDAKTLLGFLRSRTDVPLLVIGHSEGAQLGTVAAAGEDVCAVIAIAGPGIPAGQIILEQLRPKLPPELLVKTEHIVAELEAGRTVADTPPELAALFRDSVQPYLVSWFAFDPAEAVAALDIPILLIFGTTDIQIPASYGERLAAAGKGAELVVIDGMNHVLKMVEPDPQAQMRSYGDPSLPLAPELITSTNEFIDSTLRGCP
jgi:pimeloyl-ACP methyl ester carboxylesterase